MASRSARRVQLQGLYKNCGRFKNVEPAWRQFISIGDIVVTSFIAIVFLYIYCIGLTTPERLRAHLFV